MVSGTGKFSNRVALVTGAGSGIGRAIATGLAVDGAKVYAVGRRKDALDETSKGHEDVYPYSIDVSKEDQVREIFEIIENREGQIDFLVNAAGVYPQDTLEAFDMEQWSAAININLIGAALTTHYALKLMTSKNFGRIITLGSKSAHRPGAVTSAYSSSKAALESMTRSVAHELLWQKDQIPDVMVDVLIPGRTATELLGPAKADHGVQRPEQVYPYIKALLLRKCGAPTGRVFYQYKVDNRGDYKLNLKRLRLKIVGLFPFLKPYLKM